MAGIACIQTQTRTRSPSGQRRLWSNGLYSWNGIANGTRAYTSNGQNQYTAVAGASVSYDGNGNLTGDGVWTYAYDLDNRLKSAAKTGYAATLAYDGEGRLRQTTLGGTVTNLLYDGTDLIAEYDSANAVLRRYVHGPGVDEPLVWYEGATTATKIWLYADHQGSIVAHANSAGTSTATYSYGPFGEPNQATGSRFRYTGQQYLGPLNLYYYKARFYSPSLGRFMQTDPIGYADDANLYAYVGNNSVNFNDPSGLMLSEAKMLSGKISDWGSQNATRFLDGTQTVLDVGGLVPGLGEPADGLNALISLGRGNYVDATLSGVAMIPFAGWGATIAKIGSKAADAKGQR